MTRVLIFQDRCNGCILATLISIAFQLQDADALTAVSENERSVIFCSPRVVASRNITLFAHMVLGTFENASSLMHSSQYIPSMPKRSFSVHRLAISKMHFLFSMHFLWPIMKTMMLNEYRQISSSQSNTHLNLKETLKKY